MSRTRQSAVRAAIGAAAICVALAASACGSSSDDDGGAARLPARAQRARADLGLGRPTPDLCRGREYTIGYDSFSDSQPFAISVADDLQAAADEMGCVRLVKLVDNLDPQTALANVKTLIQQRVDGVVLFQVLADAQAGIARELRAAGIPAVATAVPAPGFPYVSNDDHGAGRQAGRALAEEFLARHPDGPSPFLIVGGRPDGGPVSKQRAQGIVDGAKEVLRDLPESQIQVIDSKGVQDEAYARTLDALSRVPADRPVLMSGENEDVIAGMYRAAQQRKRGDLLVMGLGGDATGLKLVCDRPQHYVGTVQFFPERWGRWLLPAVISEIQRTGLPETVYIPTEVQRKADVRSTYPEIPCG